ncbi:unnamed protein product [Rotaria magnacalcarata]|uniref:YTH domain-containing protein n=3 Tax=Rotaria magnacalcarata TaxID=392030 RepID=A0A816MTR8_9BILA|nr:unnamed protein product [Rotaria magnacalcarata]CAF1999703.1 unnamed protein product [Rotaria magnacalcarata]CAF3942709.1 unnamed protein product [Rotaria magnacalcarata]CAF3964130.1 unnamed protein product [Rotaria magnacalcarata]
MINEHSSAQSNNPTSTNMQYGYPTSRFNLMNISPMQNPNDMYSYYPPSLYQPFGTFDEHNQWTSTDTSAGIPAAAPPGPLQYHPQMYPTSGLDMSRNPFDYPPVHAYPHYHPGFTPSTFPGAPTTGTTAFDMPWKSHNLSMQVGIQQQQIQPIGGQISNKKPSVYDEYPSTSGGVGDMLAQHMNSIDLSDNNNRMRNYVNGRNDHTQNFSVLSSNEQQNYQTSSSNHSIARPSSSSGPKSYASVVSSDNINLPSNKSTASISNTTIHSTNERTSNISNDTSHTRSNTQQYRNNTAGYNPRHQQQQSSGNNGNFLNWTNNNSDRSYNNNNTSNNNAKRQNYSSSRTVNSNPESLETSKTNQYNPKDFNLNPKGARFFVIKSYSEDDVHRSIKYNIWCSTEHGNKRLDNAFREREGKGPIYLFYSVNASGHFCGMAEMMSPIDYEHQTDVWHMSNKWQGKFEVKWIYVKDVPNQQFRNIRLENNENKPVTNSRDTQEIPYEKGKLMLKTLHMYRHKTSIFDDFQYYESKQADEVTTKQYPNDDFNHSNTRSNRTSAHAQFEQQNDEQDHEE